MFDEIKAILIEQAQIEADAIVPSAELVADLGLNSLELADLMLTCEEKFDIEVKEEAIKQFIRVSDIVDYIESETGAAR